MTPLQLKMCIQVINDPAIGWKAKRALLVLVGIPKPIVDELVQKDDDL